MSRPQKRHGKWRIRWIDETGTRHSQTFTDRDVAALALRKATLLTEERRQGLRGPELKARTFLDASGYWRENRVPQKRSGGDDVSMLRQLEPVFGPISLNDPGAWPLAVDRYSALKAALNKKTLNNHLTLLSSVLRLAHRLGWMERLPHIQKPRVKLLASDFSYLRTRDEVARFLSTADLEGAMAGMLYRTAIYTGLRAGELAGLLWEDVNFDQRLIHVQRSFEGPTKSDAVRHVPIVDALLSSLRTWRLTHPGKFVFANRDGGMLRPSGRLFQEVLHRVLDRAQFPLISRGGKQRRYIHFHDLRHTFASHWVMNGGCRFSAAWDPTFSGGFPPGSQHRVTVGLWFSEPLLGELSAFA